MVTKLFKSLEMTTAKTAAAAGLRLLFYDLRSIESISSSNRASFFFASASSWLSCSHKRFFCSISFHHRCLCLCPMTSTFSFVIVRAPFLNIMQHITSLRAEHGVNWSEEINGTLCFCAAMQWALDEGTRRRQRWHCKRSHYGDFQNFDNFFFLSPRLNLLLRERSSTSGRRAHSWSLFMSQP